MTTALVPGPTHVDLDFTFDSRTALVTGGASGIGSAIAGALAARGARVAIVDVKHDAALARAHELGGGAIGLACDVTSEESVAEVVDAVHEEFGRIDVVVNSAGIGLLGAAEDLPLDVWQRTLDVNLTGTFLVCRAAGRHMLNAGYGRVVNLASQAATVAIDGHAAYCASKFGVIGLTRVLALEWGGRGVTANTISPTVVLTELGRDAWDNEKGQRHQAEIPVGRFAVPDEIAAAAVFLASEAAAMVNGADLAVDGGFTIR